MSDRTTRDEDTWAIHKAPHAAEGLCRNLRRMRIEDAVRPNCAGGGVAVLGSGHTLPSDLEAALAWLRHPVTIAVNSSLVACLARGVVPDFVICRESIDMSSCFETAARGFPVRHKRKFPHVILDAQTSPDTWTTCERLGFPVSWFVPASMQTFALAHQLGVRPVYAGQSSVTAAIALAVHMGFRDVTLVGCTRAFSRDGRAYADGAQWDSVRLDAVEVVEDPAGRHYVATIVGRERQAALHDASGQRPPLRRERVVPIERVDGTLAWATEGLADGKLWMERFARRHPHVTFRQVGAADDVPLKGFDGGAPADPPDAQPDRLSEARAHVLRGAVLARELAEALVSGGSVADVENPLATLEVVGSHYIGKRKLAVRAAGRDPRNAIPAACHVMGESADRIAELVAGDVPAEGA